ncbi:hypothetical protein ACFSY7_03570 [Kurthia populi]|uniref:XRE family transcriptional regulator n=1 Tax=Kurthia populi TaxID=1562132 RepID=A0ABW5XX87_9BACL
MKKVINAHKPLTQLIEDEKIPNTQLAVELNYSNSAISRIKCGDRAMSQETAKESMLIHDNAKYIAGITHEFTDGFTPPVLDGIGFDMHRLVLLNQFKNQEKEVYALLQQVDFSKMPSEIDEKNLKDITDVMDGLLTLRFFLENSVIQLQQDYEISIKKRMRALMLHWKMKGWLK